MVTRPLNGDESITSPLRMRILKPLRAITPVKGGLDYREAHVVMEMAAESDNLIALDLVEVNPTLDLRNTTAELGVELALSALGKQIL